MESNVPPSPPPQLPNPPAGNIPPPLLSQMRPGPSQKKGRGWKIFAFVLVALLALSVLTNLGGLFSFLLAESPSAGGPQMEEVVLERGKSGDKIVIVPVAGIISSAAYDGSGAGLPTLIKHQLKRAARDGQVKAIILKIESPGGEVLASDDIYREIQKFQSEHDIPVIAVMGSMAASGGYYVAAPCRWIVANELTITGSIGVIIHSYNYRGLMDKVGLRPEIYKSGRFKDMLSGDKKENEITAEERQIVQSLVDQTFEKFKSVVAEGRKDAAEWNSGEGRKLAGNWEEYADGRVLSGKEAHRLGFVDELGTFDTAVARAKKIAGIQSATLVRYDPVFDLSSLFHLFGKSDAHSVKVDLGLDLPKLKAGYLYLLAPTFVH